MLVCSAILLAAVIIGQLFDQNGFDDANIVSLFILAVVLCCLSSKRTIMCVITSLIAIFLFDYMFVAPRGHLYTYNSGYLVTFGVTFATAVIIGILTQNLKTSSYMSAQSSFRTKILFDTNRNLQKNTDAEDIIATTLKQISHMTGRNTAFLKYEKPVSPGGGSVSTQAVYNLYNTTRLVEQALAEEYETALWSIENCRLAGASTEHGKSCQFLYIPCFSSTRKDGVVAIELHSEVLDALESSVARAIVSEGSLALENIELSKAIKDAEMKTRSEKIRADLLRAISHDLRTPLTIISGSVGNLRESAGDLSDEEKLRIYDDIHENTVWLTNLVENLLTASHFENGSVQIHPQIELISDVIEEVLARPIHKSSNRSILIDSEDDYLMARMDGQMIARLLHNLITNAMENTEGDVPISIHTFQEDGWAVIEVIDEGQGISDELKPQIFDMFYIGNRKIVDSRKSMGLGLFLCSNIAKAHGGSLDLKDNVPHGCIFTLKLPLVALEEDLGDTQSLSAEPSGEIAENTLSSDEREIHTYEQPLTHDPIEIGEITRPVSVLPQALKKADEYDIPYLAAAADEPLES